MLGSVPDLLPFLQEQAAIEQNLWTVSSLVIPKGHLLCCILTMGTTLSMLSLVVHRFMLISAMHMAHM